MRYEIKQKQTYNNMIEYQLHIFEQAKSLIEEHGIDDYVMEARQLSCVGGAGYVVTHKDELDEKYIGYSGFRDYKTVCDKLKKLNDIDIEEYKRKEAEEMGKYLKIMFKKIKHMKS